MFAAYVAVTLLAAAANALSAASDFFRFKAVLHSLAKAKVPESLMPLLGTLKAAGAIGLLVGFAVPLIGTAAAIGIILFFTLAICAHLRARDYSIAPPAGFLLLAVAALTLGLAHRGFW